MSDVYLCDYSTNFGLILLEESATMYFKSVQWPTDMEVELGKTKLRCVCREYSSDIGSDGASQV